jgi:hypothetical protein
LNSKDWSFEFERSLFNFISIYFSYSSSISDFSISSKTLLSKKEEIEDLDVWLESLTFESSIISSYSSSPSSPSSTSSFWSSEP